MMAGPPLLRPLPGIFAGHPSPLWSLLLLPVRPSSQFQQEPHTCVSIAPDWTSSQAGATQSRAPGNLGSCLRRELTARAIARRSTVAIRRGSCSCWTEHAPPYRSLCPSPPAWMREGAPGQPWEQMPARGPHAEVWLKPSLSPKGCAREEELKSLLMQTTDLHPHNLLCKLSACETSEQTSIVPTVEMSLP